MNTNSWWNQQLWSDLNFKRTSALVLLGGEFACLAATCQTSRAALWQLLAAQTHWALVEFMAKRPAWKSVPAPLWVGEQGSLPTQFWLMSAAFSVGFNTVPDLFIKSHLMLHMNVTISESFPRTLTFHTIWCQQQLTSAAIMLFQNEHRGQRVVGSVF